MAILIVSGIGILLLFTIVTHMTVMTLLTTLNRWIQDILETDEITRREATDFETHILLAGLFNLQLDLSDSDKFKVFRFKEIRDKTRELVMFQKVRNYLSLTLILHVAAVLVGLKIYTSH